MIEAHLIANAIICLAIASVVAIVVLQETRVPNSSTLATRCRYTHATRRFCQDLGQDVSVINVVLIGNVVNGGILESK